MRKIQYSIYKRETGTASGKAKSDCMLTLEQMGFAQLYDPSPRRPVRVLQQAAALWGLCLQKERKLFVVQYPAVHERFYKLIRRALHKDDVGVAIVHDIPALQYEQIGQALQEDIRFLNIFQYVVVPNGSMRKLLEENGLRSRIVNMEIYDYLHDGERDVTEEPFSNTVCFAGNLVKSTFLKDLGSVPGVGFLLYGAGGEALAGDNVVYKGSLPSDELVYRMEGDYGLVWDGSSVDECAGTSGRYLLYNSPHKLSAYISAGKPVVIWEKAAAARFVKENGIGIAVGSLKELADVDLRADHAAYKANAAAVKKRLAAGIYLRRAMETILRAEDHT